LHFAEPPPSFPPLALFRSARATASGSVLTISAFVARISFSRSSASKRMRWRSNESFAAERTRQTSVSRINKAHRRTTHSTNDLRASYSVVSGASRSPRISVIRPVISRLGRHNLLRSRPLHPEMSSARHASRHRSDDDRDCAAIAASPPAPDGPCAIHRRSSGAKNASIFLTLE